MSASYVAAKQIEPVNWSAAAANEQMTDTEAYSDVFKLEYLHGP